MAVSLPNGVVLALATAYASSQVVSAVSSASEAIATATGHTLVNGDLVEFTSGWSKANGRIFRVKGVATNTFTLEGLDTTSANLFPAGSGAGSVRKITGWTQISQVLESTSQGGEQQFANYSFLENDFQSQIPTETSAQSISISIADDPALAGYQALKAANGTKVAVGLRATLPSGSLILYNAYVGFDETPSMTKGQVMACKASFSLVNRPVRYTA